MSQTEVDTAYRLALAERDKYDAALVEIDRLNLARANLLFEIHQWLQDAKNSGNCARSERDKLIQILAKHVPDDGSGLQV